MKKILFILTILLSITTLSACQTDDEKTITVIATSIPHAEILEFVKPMLLEKGYQLNIVITSDYYFPNPSVLAKDADANFFQHEPFLNAFNRTQTHSTLEIAAYVHIEPIGLYASTYQNVNQVENGASVLLSNSKSDHGRALKLLADAGLITLKENIDITSPTLDILDSIATNPKNLVFRAEVAPDFLMAAYMSKEADLYVINSNYVLEGGKNPTTDSIFIESTQNNPYVNILVTTSALLQTDKLQALANVLNSIEVKNFINNKYNGSVIPA